MALFSRIPFDKKQIESVIVALESKSSAELRVYIERKIPYSDKISSVFDRTLQVFEQLEMHKTQRRNAVLIYIAHKDHQCAIYGDKGIHELVGQNYWQQEYEIMISHFKAQEYTQGVVDAINHLAEKLAVFFPIQPDDVNELDDGVIIND